MAFMTIRELRSSVGVLDDVLARDGKAVITNRGKPAYVMLPVNEDNLEDTLLGLKRLTATNALRQIQRQAVDNGTSTMTMAEIDAEIAASRAERRLHKDTKR